MRPYELEVHLPGKVDPISPIPFEGLFDCAPGVFALALDAPETMRGGLELPSEVAERLRSDCGTVLAVGEGVDLPVGESVIVRPYSGYHLYDCEFKNGVSLPRLAFYGLNSPWQSCVLAVYDGARWMPSEGWVALRSRIQEKVNGIYVPNPGAKPRSTTGRVVRVAEDETNFGPGDTVLVSGTENDSYYFRFPWIDGDLSELEWVRTSNVVAVVEDLEDAQQAS